MTDLKYPAVIPLEILKDPNICDKQKYIIGLIMSLTSKCLIKNNEYIAELLGLNPNYVSGLISDLEQKKYITIIGNQSRWRKIYLSKILPEKPESKGEILPEKAESKTGLLSGISELTFRKILNIVFKRNTITKDIIVFVNQFEESRRVYPGGKRGLEPEIENFYKKHKTDAADILPLLKPAIQKQIEYKKYLQSTNQFCSNWKHFKTWINNACWTEEIPDINTATVEADPDEADKIFADMKEQEY